MDSDKLKRIVRRSWARRKLLARALTMCVFATAIALSMLGYSADDQSGVFFNSLMLALLGMGAFVMVVMAILTVIQEWNYNFIPVTTITIEIQSSYDARAKQITDLCKRHGIAHQIDRDYDRDNDYQDLMTIGFADEEDAILVKMSV